MLNFPTDRVEVCHVTIPMPNLLDCYDGLRLVQLSDFHFGDGLDPALQHRALPPRLLAQVIQEVQALTPDLICYTGDFVNGNPDSIDSLCQTLKQISGRLGNFAVLGNHDYLSQQGAARVTQSLEQSNIHVLSNEVCYPCGPDLALVGFECLWPHYDPLQFDPSPVLAKIPSSIPKIVLTHSPHFSEFLKRWTIELQLSGHTHGGQLALPGLGPLIPVFWRFYHGLPKSMQRHLFQRMPRRMRMTQNSSFLRGLYETKQGLLYVNRGLGAHRPGRLFCRPEITVITLKSLPASP